METQPTVQSSHRILLGWYSIKDQISENQQVSRGRSKKLTEILSKMSISKRMQNYRTRLKDISTLALS